MKLKGLNWCCAQDNHLPEESTNQAETDATGDVPNTTRTENNREKQSTQYLTRFGNVPTSSGQGRERFYWFNNQLQLIPSSKNFQWRFSVRYNIWGLYPLFIAIESLGFRKPQLDSIPTRKGIRIPKGKQKTRRSTDPCPRSTGRSTGP